MRRLGILGGTFDPPHIGHLILAERARDVVGLERVLFAPTGDPPLKDDTRTSIDHRFEMVRLAIQRNAAFSVSRADIDRPGPHYTVDLMRLLSEQHQEAELYFLMGGDSLRDLPKWNRPDELIRLAHLIVMGRPGADIAPDMHETAIPGLAARVIMIEAPTLGVSSTMVASLLREGRSVRYLVPPPVLDYISEHRLYVDE